MTSLAENTAEKTLSLSDHIRAVAQEGLKYAKDPYDKARYERLLEISAANFADVLDLDFENLLEDFRREIGSITPKLGADAAVFNDKGEMLVLKRSDDKKWCLPCGWVDVGESPATAVVREVREETGLTVEATGYLSISTKGPGKTQNIQHQVNIIVAVNLISDPENLVLSHEHTDSKWIRSGEGVEWHPGHDKQAERIFRWMDTPERATLPIE